jgi:hypothetical protein
LTIACIAMADEVATQKLMQPIPSRLKETCANPAPVDPHYFCLCIELNSFRYAELRIRLWRLIAVPRRMHRRPDIRKSLRKNECAHEQNGYCHLAR